MSHHSEEVSEVQEGHQPRLNEVAHKFISDLETERAKLTNDLPLCKFLIEDAVDRIHATGRIPGKEYYADVYQQKPIKITQKVFVPIRQYPKFNFVGKLLGPKGHSLRRLEDETQCRITIKGRNSMRDRVKEEDLRNSNDLRYAHLNKDLYVEVSTVATPAESYARVAYALAEIRKYLVPDKNDEVSHDQLREMMEIDPSMAKIKPIPHQSYLSKYQPARKLSYAESRYMKMVRPTDAYGNEFNEAEEDDHRHAYHQEEDDGDVEREEEIDEEDDEEVVMVPQKQRYVSAYRQAPPQKREPSYSHLRVKSFSSLHAPSKALPSTSTGGGNKRLRVPVLETQPKRLRIAPPPPRITKSYGMKH